MYWQTNNMKMEKNEFQKVRLKNLSCNYFDDISNGKILILIIF